MKSRKIILKYTYGNPFGIQDIECIFKAKLKHIPTDLLTALFIIYNNPSKS